MGGFLQNEVKPIVIWSISVVNSLRMGVLLFIDGPALVCRWVNFSDPVATHPVQTKLKCPPPPRECHLLQTLRMPICYKAAAIGQSLIDGQEVHKVK